MLLRISALLIASFAAACSSQGVNTLDRLTTSASNDGGYAKPANLIYPFQTRFLALNGQLPVPSIGSSCLASSRRVANSIICFSPNPTSQVVTKQFTYQPSTQGAAADLQAVQDQLTSLQTNLSALLSSIAAREKDSDLPPNSALAKTVINGVAEATDAAQRNNMFLFRWTSEYDRGASGTFGADLARATGGAAGSDNGLVIVAGLRVSQVLISPEDFEAQFDRYPSGAKFATLTMSAENLLYFAYRDAAATLSASVDSTLAKLGSITPQEEFALRAYASLGTAQENRGQFSAPSVRSKPLTQGLDDNWQIFYATMTDIDEMREAVNR